jgi:HNH endonuclease
MKICIECNKEYQEKKPFEKYCSLKCCKIFQYRIEIKKRRENKEYRERRNFLERQRRKLKRDKSKHAQEERARYRKKHNILTDKDLKVAPKGAGCITRYGYKKIHKKNHPNAWKNGDMFEHVYIMSEHLNRPLKKGETVHHRNGIKSDNRIDNLELWSSSHPYGQKVEDKISWCKEFLEFYGFDVIKK